MAVIPRRIGFIPNFCSYIALDCHLDHHSMCEKLPAHGKVSEDPDCGWTSGQLKACPAMRNEGGLRNEPNKPLVFSLPVYSGVRGQRGRPRFANCFSGAGFTSTIENDPDTSIVP